MCNHCNASTPCWYFGASDENGNLDSNIVADGTMFTQKQWLITRTNLKIAFIYVESCTNSNSVCQIFLNSPLTFTSKFSFLIICPVRIERRGLIVSAVRMKWSVKCQAFVFSVRIRWGINKNHELVSSFKRFFYYLSLKIVPTFTTQLLL